MKTFNPVPITVCPSPTSICTYPSCPCALSYMPNDMYEPTPEEKYRHGWDRIFKTKKLPNDNS